MNELPDKIVSTYAPVVIDTLQGRYAVYAGAGWYPVDDTFTEKDALDRWEKWMPESLPVEESIENQSWEVESSKKGKFYTVRYRNGHWSCNCPANTYYRGNECKHIKSTRKQSK